MRNLAAANFRRKDGEELGKVFGALSSPVRVQIVNLLINEGAMISTKIQDKIGNLSQPTISHHLNVLNRAGLLNRRMDSAYAIWSVNHPLLRTLAETIQVSV
jgi:ArsR family transcriptional regulator